MKERYYTISENNGKWCVWINVEDKHSFGCTSIFKANSRKECVNYCKDNNIAIRRK